MRKLTLDEINKVTDRSDINKEVVESFLRSMGTDVLDVIGKLCDDGKKNGWDEKTIVAILEGIGLALW